MKGGSLLFAVILGVTCAGLLVDLLSLGPAARRVPLMIGVPTLILLGAQVIVEVKGLTRPDAIAFSGGARGARRAEGRAILMVVALVGACSLVGPFVAVPAFAALATRFVIRSTLTSSVAAGIVAMALIWLLFSVILARPLPRGIWSAAW